MTELLPVSTPEDQHAKALRERQVQREGAARDAALGRRAKAIAEGHLGPVLKRWINGAVVPIADLLRTAARAYLAGNMAGVAEALDTPTSELGSVRERPLAPLMEWLLRGSSPGRANETTFAEDIVLAFMASTLSRIAQDKASLASALSTAADTLRDTIHGQFIVSIQGASAMQALRERNPHLWQQKKSLKRISAQLLSQVKPQLAQAEEAGTLNARGKHVLQVLDHKGTLRRIDLLPPDAVAWQILSLCFREENSGASPESRNLWLGFAGMVLAAAQKQGGWFEVATKKTGRKGHTRTTKLLVLSEKAHEAIRADVERWMGMGFYAEPMLVQPEGGDYLTVKHRKVNGQRPPKGLLTDPTGTDAWAAAEVLASTPWTVNPYALAYYRANPIEETDTAGIMRLAEHRRLAQEEALYLPTSMDFRGRIYYRTPWMGPQSADMGKSLICFPPSTAPRTSEAEQAVVMHLAALKGGGGLKLDKAPYPVRLAWWKGKLPCEPSNGEADKPLSYRAAQELYQAGEWDRIPIQLDGTCNGLQHLSALFRDEAAAPLVNLTASTLNEPPADLYGAVARVVKDSTVRLKGGSDVSKWPGWLQRLSEADLEISRSLTKGPVMVLPYGGTREAVRLAVKRNVLDQMQERYGHTRAEGTPWENPEDPKFQLGDAFKDRDLHDHPLFNTDVGLLSGLVWDSIAPAIPRAMAAMATLQAIGSFVGERGLAWRTGIGEHPLWVIQAKSKASRKQVTMRGFHLPDMVRRLTLMANSNEVDPKAHRSGIVANFIHSLDAAHLAATLLAFRRAGGGCVGSIHDALLVRPSEATLMGRCLRDTFVELYERDPLSSPVRIIPLDGSPQIEYLTWHHLAEAAGVSFPERGTFDISQVRASAWFFS